MKHFFCEIGFTSVHFFGREGSCQ